MKAFLFFLVFLFPILCHAQEIIQGIVVDSASFAPLPYVNVKIKNQTKGTITDEQGNFKLVATKADTLQISYTGYNTIELALQDWVESVILLPEKVTVLNTITVKERRIDNPYEGMLPIRRDVRRTKCRMARSKQKTALLLFQIKKTKH
jgi:hypothetical protein